MRAILEVRFGPDKGRKATVPPGGRLRVGRTERADLVFPGDRRMSGLHCEVTWDGRTCHVEDLGSHEGILLSGRPAKAGDVEHGGWFRAGDTVVMVYHEEHTPPRLGADTAWTEAKSAALAAIEAEEAPLFAVLDAARTPRIRELLRESAEPYRSLFDGIQAESLDPSAPHLVGLPRGTRLLPSLVREGWGHRWGVYLTHPGKLDEVRRHLRRFLRVENEETRRPMYFRFYDPAVLRVFVPACSVLERADFFRDTLAMMAEGEHGNLLRFTASDEQEQE